jgi:hypothetical protein
MTIPPFARLTALAAAGALALVAMPVGAGAQIRTVDPNAALQNDLAPVPPSEAGYGTRMAVDTPPPVDTPTIPGEGPAPASQVAPAAGQQTTYRQEDVIDAAEGVFGRGAEGLAKLVENILKDQGEPNAYITGREAGGAIVVGVRYGSGVLHHKIEGDQPVYWTGPSVGFDLGANGAKTFVLVYNLYDTQDLFERFPAAEGNVYVVGGFTASYLRRGNIVLIPIRLGVGWRLGANVGYMKFTKTSKILPF